MKPLESAHHRLKLRQQQLGFDFKRSLGQNFLVSDHVIDQILLKASQVPCDEVLEIGPGLGALTDGLRLQNAPLKLIELDQRLVEYWREAGLEVEEGDALRWNWHQLDPALNFLLVSNLPYQISSSLVIDRSLGPDNLKWMILMFQKEVAQRIQAQPKTSEYGLLSVMAQAHYEIRKLVDASPGDFKPSPKVASRVLYFERKDQEKDRREDQKFSEDGSFDSLLLLRLLKQGFSQRRKKLVKNLHSLLPEFRRSLEELETWLKAKGKTALARAEELSPKEWIQLCHWIKEG